MKKRIIFRLRADADRQSFGIAAFDLIKSQSGGDCFLGFSETADGLCELRAISREDRMALNMMDLANRIDFVLSDREGRDVVLSRLFRAPDARLPTFSSVQAHELRKLAHALRAIASGKDPAQALGLKHEDKHRHRSAAKVARDFEIALARHRRGDGPRASDIVADEFGCDRSTVDRARRIFSDFLDQYVEPSEV